MKTESHSCRAGGRNGFRLVSFLYRVGDRLVGFYFHLVFPFEESVVAQRFLR